MRGGGRSARDAYVAPCPPFGGWQWERGGFDGLELRNDTLYRGEDVRALVLACRNYLRVREELVVWAIHKPARHEYDDPSTRGCADIGGRRFVLAIARPERLEMRVVALKVEHELRHVRGEEHEEMPTRILYAEGPMPLWARGLPLRVRA